MGRLAPYIRVRSAALSPDHYSRARPLGFTVGPGQSQVRRMHSRSPLYLSDREKSVISSLLRPNHCTDLHESRRGCGSGHWCCLRASPSIPPGGLAFSTSRIVMPLQRSDEF
ncbi:uncharacterized protein BDV14DRAFT_29134 [Aspergillus stella-maris]|uniref:uncharacterized protein n=1 Tax=Aspergillus stella-maris TaxID=1810926 RepID=UPI003CCD61A7